MLWIPIQYIRIEYIFHQPLIGRVFPKLWKNFQISKSPRTRSIAEKRISRHISQQPVEKRIGAFFSKFSDLFSNNLIESIVVKDRSALLIITKSGKEFYSSLNIGGGRVGGNTFKDPFELSYTFGRNRHLYSW
jgi:hypothetical protein